MVILKKTLSLCPVCLKQIEACYVENRDEISLEKDCPEHGHFSTTVAKQKELYHRWFTGTNNVQPSKVLTPRDKGCPFDCGPCEEHLQTACCVLLEVTERCNQNCPYCFASSGDNGAGDPTIEEIGQWYDKLLDQGEERPFNVQLSGGEPTVRDDLPQIIKLAREKGFPYIQLNTNGKRLGLENGYAARLKEAGLSAVFLQFDGTNDEINIALRGKKLLELKKKTIQNCKEAYLPVALVPTMVSGVNTQNIGELIRFALDNLDTVKGIHFQPVSYFGRFPNDDRNRERVTMFDVMSEIEKQTGGKILSSDLYPLVSGHNLCSFYGTFIKKDNGEIASVVQKESTQKSLCNCCMPPSKIIAKDRDFIKNKWQLPPKSLNGCCGGEEDGLDAFLREFRERSFTLTGMQFQDGLNIDLERVKRCRVHVFSKHKTFVPFCAFNLTNTQGEYIHRGK